MSTQKRSTTMRRQERWLTERLLLQLRLYQIVASKSYQIAGYSPPTALAKAATAALSGFCQTVG